MDLAAPPLGGRVLDVAAGPGGVAVAAAQRVGADGSVLATDLVPEWEPYVRESAQTAGVTNVTFAAMPADALALPDAAFDAVFCQFGLMFVPDPVAALREMRRVLRPGGTLGVVVWSEPEKVGIFLIPRIVATALPPAEGAGPSPTSMGEPGLIEGLVAAAGFTEIAVHAVTRWHEITDPESEWRRWSEDAANPAAVEFSRLPEQERDRVRREALAALEALREGAVVRVPSEAIVVTARR
jgi:SAM-dependent methyltransferase